MIPQEPEESVTKPETAETEDIEALKKTLAEEKAKAEDYLAGWQRAQADFINYKRRIEQEREDVVKQANTSLVLSILPVLDDIERAFASIPPDANKDEFRWVEGFKFVERKLRAILEAQGLSPIKAVGELFDPKFHEAAMQSKGKEGIVVSELQKGYKLHDKVLRPAKVVVGSGEEEEKEEK